ncbi:hypothetical protein SAMN05216359_102549 [Roseateles sp. YR242]|nr:hypothetical protein SAMN05216359_102549 [Roseateles sp. YR242]
MKDASAQPTSSLQLAVGLLSSWLVQRRATHSGIRYFSHEHRPS